MRFAETSAAGRQRRPQHPEPEYHCHRRRPFDAIDRLFAEETTFPAAFAKKAAE